jgi:hypothetical protein
MTSTKSHFPSFPLYTLAGLGMPRRVGRWPEIPSSANSHISHHCNTIADPPCVVPSRFPGHSQPKSCCTDSQCIQTDENGAQTRLDHCDSRRKEAIR